jgi:hypothetical protein
VGRVHKDVAHKPSPHETMQVLGLCAGEIFFVIIATKANIAKIKKITSPVFTFSQTEFTKYPKSVLKNYKW